ncbi:MULTISPECIES: hypothetical protein [Limnothrix]|uniref:Uncharacterized protein n=1 Tax=Limnothrix redekei LRLZ20PSL1 TaxID=3112953 RepID=A0ABW7C7R3_9CYAN|nr:hypothetical protein [Limnothrix sp. FACHB-1083]
MTQILQPTRRGDRSPILKGTPELPLQSRNPDGILGNAQIS